MASKRAIALLSHIEFSEANSTLLLQAWISPTNKVKMKQSGRVAHLGFRIHTFDNKLQTWSSQSYSSTRVTAYVQTREDQQDQKLWLELTPDHTVQQHVWLPGENGQWVTWNMTCKNEQG
ncbi:hypothetical protein BY458DRAFT_438400 [Sporodiniella umbellata]|nr:hypothetical protein BY458DRAFT_438400 [Sporodiniella umbellata]